jgi:hypothetical protein
MGDVAHQGKSSHNGNAKCSLVTLSVSACSLSVALSHHWRSTRLAGHVLNVGLLKAIRILDCMVSRVGYTARRRKVESGPMRACCEGIGWPMQASFSGRSGNWRLVAANHESVPGMRQRKGLFVLRNETHAAQ